MRGWSLSSSIQWIDCEVVLVAGTRVVGSEGIVGLSDIDTASAGDSSGFISHIVDQERVPYIILYIGYIQRIGSSP